jgi:hypothetical protein
MENLLIYGSIFDALDDLTNEEAGVLFKALNAFRKGEEVEFEDRYLKGLWKGIKPNLDNVKANYDNKVKANQENGKKGGRPKKELITETLPTEVIEDIKLENKVAEIEDNESLNELKEILDSEYPMKTDIERLLISVIKNTNSYQLSELSKKIKKEDIKGDSIKEFLISNNIELK